MNTVKILKTTISETTLVEVSKILNNESSLKVAVCNTNTVVRSYRDKQLSKIINSFCRLILGNDIKDYTSSIFLMHRNVLKCGVPIAYGHGEFFIEFLYKIKKNGMTICELPYIQPPDAEGSKTASSILRFFTLGFGYLIRILSTRFRRN